MSAETENDKKPIRWATGRIASVDFDHEQCANGEMMLSIITPADDVRAGLVYWRLVRLEEVAVVPCEELKG